MRLFSLITVTDEELFHSSTLSFETLRVGFPTADITICINGSSKMQKEVKEKAEKYNLPVYQHERSLFHADWIDEVIKTNASQVLYGKDDRFIIADGDCIFWKSMEHIKPSHSFWKGFYVPTHHNEWSNTLSMPRLHPSLIFGYANGIMSALRTAYPRAFQSYGEYCGFKPFHPVTVFSYGKPLFYDTLANAFNAISGEVFSEEELDCYDHLNSASFFNIMLDRFSDNETKDAFTDAHFLAKVDPTKLKGYWRKVQKYYDKRRSFLQ